MLDQTTDVCSSLFLAPLFFLDKIEYSFSPWTYQRTAQQVRGCDETALKLSKNVV